MKKKSSFQNHLFLSLVFLLQATSMAAQKHSEQLWHNKQRTIHYLPDGKDFVTLNGTRRFNRALYGSNTGFRAEAGDLPEFALYMPGMGGNLKFGLISGDNSKWLINTRTIEARYRPGSMLYTIHDALLDEGQLNVTAIGLYTMEGLIVKVEAKNIPKDLQLLAGFGGATGTRFSREGDIGADPESSFYLKPEYCKDNIYKIKDNTFDLYYGSGKTLTEEQRYEIQHNTQPGDTSGTEPLKIISGVFPFSSLRIGDATAQQSPGELFSAVASASPVLVSKFSLKSDSSYYFLVVNGKIEKPLYYEDLPELFRMAEMDRKEIADRIIVSTPDPYINTIGGTLSIAADAIWESPSYMHGAVAWRMRLNGWRGAYAADVLGWHDRARLHFNSYALSQLTTPLNGPVVMDTALHLARAQEKLGTSLFSRGYISRNPNGDFRPHHYDMNLVFIDQLLNHFLWTGDTGYVKKMWPLLTRHLDWEKRNFDVDGDGLYDAYAAIWASDALQYSGGGVTHSSAYNYRANKVAAELAGMISEDGTPYETEAQKILKAINSDLWLRTKGWYAEYKDLLGKKLVHPAAALWTVYHAIDSRVPDAFQSYQLLKYVDTEIPRIPVRATGLNDAGLYTVSTSNWQPYDWSLNNVVLAEVLHTALAYWQGGRNEEAYTLWKSALIESMYLGASPGNIQQLSFYDAIRGELYRDFADDIGMAARSLVEGLFGIMPDVLHDTLYINPGFPEVWNQASIHTPDIDFSFDRKNNTDTYNLFAKFPRRLNILLRVKARLDNIEYVTVNGKKQRWIFDGNAIGSPVVNIPVPVGDTFLIEIKWKGNKIDMPVIPGKYAKGQTLTINARQTVFSKVYDPQKALLNIIVAPRMVKAVVTATEGNKTFFVRAKQGHAFYWIPFSFSVVNPAEAVLIKKEEKFLLTVTNNTAFPSKGKLFVNTIDHGSITIPANSTQTQVIIEPLVAGTTNIRYESGKNKFNEKIINWDLENPAALKYDKIDLTAYFNAELDTIFRNQYLSPRPVSSTLQLPTQGIGNWAYPLITAAISDSGLKRRAMGKNEIIIQQGIPFAIDPDDHIKNIVFTSRWDNYPDSAVIPLKGKASHAYFLMAGSTNPMQSRMVNGLVIIYYKDGSSDQLELKNPESWWPIEQDYYEDGYAFTTDAPKPVRVYLKTGEDTRSFNTFTTIRGFTNRAIDGGAATVLDLPVNPSKELKSILISAIANDVVIGMMAITLVRP